MKVAQSISVAALVLASAALAQNPGLSPFDDPARGKLIAETWCTSCHFVAAGERRDG